jgi:hypothetical protein
VWCVGRGESGRVNLFKEETAWIRRKEQLIALILASEPFKQDYLKDLSSSISRNLFPTLMTKDPSVVVSIIGCF